MTEIILDLNRRIGALMSEVHALEIKDDAGYKDADTGMSKSLNIEKKIIEHFAEKKAEPAKVLKALREQEQTMIGHIKAACSLITIKMANYTSKRDVLDRERREAEQKEHEKAVRVEAFEMAEAGIPKDAIDAVIDQSKEKIDLSPLPELRGKTQIKPAYIINLIAGEDDLIPRDLLAPTTEAMKKALVAKIRAVIKVTGVTKIPGVEIIETVTSKRRDFK